MLFTAEIQNIAPYQPHTTFEENVFCPSQNQLNKEERNGFSSSSTCRNVTVSFYSQRFIFYSVNNQYDFSLLHLISSQPQQI